MTLRAILKDKPAQIISVTPDTGMRDVIDVLAEKHIGAVLVVDDHGALKGILSERDIVRVLAARASETFELAAADLMTKSPVTASPDITVAKAMEMMTDGRFRHLPIVENGVLTGLVSIGDVVKARLMQQEHEVDSLRAYVVGTA
jgi:CBS domain-containing protein